MELENDPGRVNMALHRVSEIHIENRRTFNQTDGAQFDTADIRFVGRDGAELLTVAVFSAQNELRIISDGLFEVEGVQS